MADWYPWSLTDLVYYCTDQSLCFVKYKHIVLLVSRKIFEQGCQKQTVIWSSNHLQLSWWQHQHKRGGCYVQVEKIHTLHLIARGLASFLMGQLGIWNQVRQLHIINSIKCLVQIYKANSTSEDCCVVHTLMMNTKEMLSFDSGQV